MKFLGGARHFTPRPTQNLPLRNGDKIGVKMSVERETKITLLFCSYNFTYPT